MWMHEQPGGLTHTTFRSAAFCLGILYFLIAAVMHYNTLAYSNTNLSYSSEGRRSDNGLTGLKLICVSRSAFLLESPGKDLFLCLFQLLEAALIPWLVDPFLPSSTMAMYHSSATFCVLTSLSDHTWERFSAFQDSCD